MDDRPLFILGKGTYAISIILDILKLRNYKGLLTIVSNIDDQLNSSLTFPYAVDGVNIREIKLQEFQATPGAGYILGSIGKSRIKIYHQFLEAHSIKSTDYISLIHPSAVIADSVLIGNGVHVGPLSVVAPFVKLGDFTVVNRNCSIGHHSVLKDFSCVNPGVNISGICEIGKNTTIGVGANVLDKVVVGDFSVIGAGSLVTKNIKDRVVAYGVPAKFIREN